MFNYTVQIIELRADGRKYLVYYNTVHSFKQACNMCGDALDRMTGYPLSVKIFKSLFGGLSIPTYAFCVGDECCFSEVDLYL